MRRGRRHAAASGRGSSSPEEAWPAAGKGRGGRGRRGRAAGEAAAGWTPVSRARAGPRLGASAETKIRGTRDRAGTAGGGAGGPAWRRSSLATRRNGGGDEKP